MSDQPQYPSYPGDDAPPPGHGQPPPPQYGQVPPPQYGQVPPPQYGQAPQGYGHAPQGYGPGYPGAPRRSSTQAVVGLVLGIVSIVFCYLGVLIGPAAIVVSVLARKEIDAAPPGAVEGRGMAIAGLVTGIIGTVFWGAVIALVIGVGVFSA